MIVKMDQITILVSQKHTNEALGQLRKLGLIHVKHLRMPTADAITAIEDKLFRWILIFQIFSLNNPLP